MPTARTRGDLARSPPTRDLISLQTSGVVLGGVSRVAINSSNTCTHYTSRLVQLLGRHLCQRWLLLCTCLVVDPSNRLILIAWAFLSVINDSIPVPTIISVVTADQMDVSASIVANHISCYLPPHLGCPKGTQYNPVTCTCDK